MSLGNDRNFIGREAILAHKKKNPGKKLACFTVADRNIILLGRETIYRNDKRVGWLSSAGWGYTVESNIGFGYVRYADGVDADYLKSGKFQLEVAGERYDCDLHLRALYDPAMKKIKS